MAGYGSDTEFQAYLVANGVTLPVGAPAAAILRQIGSDYVDAAYEHALACSRRADGFTQDRAWPRVGHVVGGDVVPSDMIPQAWVSASYRAAYLQASQSGWAQGGRDPSRMTKREKVDVIEREFFTADELPSGGRAAPGFNVDPLIDGMVGMWLCVQGRDLNSLFMVI